MGYVVGIDIGGTCTDCVVVDEGGKVTLGKVFSTPPDFSSGILDSVGVVAEELGIERSMLLAESDLFLHSTTVAENAVVDGTLAAAGVIVNRGFEDTLFSTRGGYGRWSGLSEEEKRNPIETDKLAPIVPRRLVRGIGERTDALGHEIVQPDEAEIEAAVKELLEQKVEALGVSLLWSFSNPRAENTVREVMGRLGPELFLTVSHEIAPIVGEYERTSTVALNSRLGPVVRRYLENLREKLVAEGFEGSFLIMQAYGGLLPFEKATASPVGMIESGPVSGLVGSQSLGKLIGFENIIAADMGGTTFKVGVVRAGRIEYQRESMVLRYHYALPKMDVVSLGLAGGSIVSIDERTGTPRIGPRSAGSYPGPVCYGHGGEEPTITDVDAILGYINPEFFLDGRAELDVGRAREVFSERIARPLEMEPLEAAAAIYKLANSLFYDLLHRTTVQRGLDPRNFALFSFGGTAGMHVAGYAEALGVRDVVVPHSASVHGAFGLITSDIAHEDQTTYPMHDPVDLPKLQQIFSELTESVWGQLNEEGFADERITLQRSIDMRYRRQVHILTVPVEGEGPLDQALLEDTIERFEALYREKYGEESAYREAGIELVSFRMRGSGAVRKPEFRIQKPGDPDASGAVAKRVSVWVDKAGEMMEVDGFDFRLLDPGHQIEGPAVIWTPITTMVIAPGQTARIDEHKNLVLSTGAGDGRPDQGRAEAKRA